MKNFLLISCVIFLFNCKKEDTKSSLEITSVKFNNTIVSTEPIVYSNDSLSITTSLKSSDGFSELYVEIHSNFNGHQHTAARTIESSDTLSFYKVYKLDGNETSLQIYQDFISEKTKSGEYHLELILLDKKGKRQEKIIAFEIEKHS